MKDKAQEALVEIPPSMWDMLEAVAQSSGVCVEDLIALALTEFLDLQGSGLAQWKPGS